MKNIYLIGFMGTGKSTISRLLANKLGLKAAEMDALIEEKQGMPIADIFDKYGEPYFRELETNVVRELSETKDMVVSCGGGTVLRMENVDMMRNSGTVILLEASPAEVLRRVSHSTARPLLNGHMNEQYIADLMNRRRPAYEAAAEERILTDGCPPEEVATLIATCIRRRS